MQLGVSMGNCLRPYVTLTGTEDSAESLKTDLTHIYLQNLYTSSPA